MNEQTDSEPERGKAVRWIRRYRSGCPGGIATVLAVVWDSGAAETVYASALNRDAPEVTVHELHHPEDVAPILDRILRDLSQSVDDG